MVVAASIPLLQLLQRLRREGLADERVLQALASVPREMFLPEPFRARAWEDFAFEIGFGQTISQPSVVARMTTLAALTPQDRVLEVGTGSGFQTAVLARLSRFVFTVERIPELAVQARQRLAALGIRNVTVQVMDGSIGWRTHAPYDVILLTAAAPALPKPLVAQLAEGGRLVAPIGDFQRQELVLAVKRSETLSVHRCGPAGFVPLVGKEGFWELKKDQRPRDHGGEAPQEPGGPDR